MLSWAFGGRLFLANEPTDLRKGYDGLSAIVQNEFGVDPMTGGAYIFLNRRLTQVRVLFWDRDGYCVLGKRLEQGTFRRVKRSDGSASVEIDAADLAMLFEGIDATDVRRRKRYKPREIPALAAG